MTPPGDEGERLTKSERDQLLTLVHGQYVRLEKPMKELEKETGLSASTMRKRWSRLGLPSMSSLAKNDPDMREKMHAMTGNKHGSNMTGDFVTIHPHGSIWKAAMDPECCVCDKVHDGDLRYFEGLD